MFNYCLLILSVYPGLEPIVVVSKSDMIEGENEIEETKRIVTRLFGISPNMVHFLENYHNQTAKSFKIDRNVFSIISHALRLTNSFLTRVYGMTGKKPRSPSRGTFSSALWVAEIMQQQVRQHRHLPARLGLHQSLLHTRQTQRLDLLPPTRKWHNSSPCYSTWLAAMQRATRIRQVIPLLRHLLQQQHHQVDYLPTPHPKPAEFHPHLQLLPRQKARQWRNGRSIKLPGGSPVPRLRNTQR